MKKLKLITDLIWLVVGVMAIIFIYKGLIFLDQNQQTTCKKASDLKMRSYEFEYHKTGVKIYTDTIKRNSNGID